MSLYCFEPWRNLIPGTGGGGVGRWWFSFQCVGVVLLCYISRGSVVGLICAQLDHVVSMRRHHEISAYSQFSGAEFFPAAGMIMASAVVTLLAAFELP
ncbi:hypothetical protein Syun_016799 [Stephania yunnanensis]|uniref:Uncharacterized protein n=1 Tax=Stephania yunnanensis TaxID=152371 RepID=A0AAP0P1T5_9MAGN